MAGRRLVRDAERWWARVSDPWRRELSEGRQSWSKVSRELVRWTTIAVPIGLIAGLGAYVFYELWFYSTAFFMGWIVGIQSPLPGSTNPATYAWSGPQNPLRILLLIPIMGLGGLGAGLLAERLAPEIAGHGTDETIRAFHRNGGRIRARVPILKILATALTLGTGGSGGREGPVAQIGGGFGSWWADLLGLSPRERRLALATGLGAGIGAIFKAPLGGAIYSAEIFYTGDFEPEVFVPAIIASVVSYSTYAALQGPTGFFSLFATNLPAVAWSPQQIPLYALLGVICAGAGVAFTRTFGRLHEWFRGMRLRLSVRASAGALVASGIVCLIYFALPTDNHFAALSALNVGYGFVQAAMLGQGGLGGFGLMALLVIAVAVVARMFTTSFTVGSGGSAGLFGTSVVIGALLGALVGGFFNSVSPSLVPTQDVAAFVIIGMMAFFGGISKAPLAVLVMVVEMASSYSLLLPAMLAIFLAYVMTGGTHIYIEQVTSRLRSPAHREEYRQMLMREVPVLALTRTDMRTLPPDTTARDALQIAAESEQYLLPVKKGEAWYGLVRVSDLLQVEEAARGEKPVSDLVRPFEVMVSADASAADALATLERTGADAAAVLGTEPSVGVRGIVTRSGLRQVQASAGGSFSGTEGPR